MASLKARVEQFITDRLPSEDVPVEALCRDNRGTYVLPFACCRFDEEWRNFQTDETALAAVISWRVIEARRGYRRLRKK